MSNLFNAIVAELPLIVVGRHNYWQYSGRDDICSRIVKSEKDASLFEVTTMGFNVFVRLSPNHFGHLLIASDPCFLDRLKQVLNSSDGFVDGWPLVANVFGDRY